MNEIPHSKKKKKKLMNFKNIMLSKRTQTKDYKWYDFI